MKFRVEQLFGSNWEPAPWTDTAPDGATSPAHTFESWAEANHELSELLGDMKYSPNDYRIVPVSDLTYIYLLFGATPEEDAVPVAYMFYTDAEREAFWIGVEAALGSDEWWSATSTEDRYCADCAEVVPPGHDHSEDGIDD